MRHSGLGILYPGSGYRKGAAPERMRRTRAYATHNRNSLCLPNSHDTEPP